MNRVYWGPDSAPISQSIDKVLYDIRRDDGAEGLLLDSVTFRDINEDADEVMALDALVTPYKQLERRMNVMLKVMQRAPSEVKPVGVQLSDPFKKNGVAQVAAVFELSDEQTVTIFFHNPDSTPQKLLPNDELISWKWCFNKKDITIVIAPEQGKDLNVHEVGLRVMKLAEKNSAAFKRANARRAECM